LGKILKDKVAVITGGGRGIGRQICLTFASLGARVAVLDVQMERAEETAALAAKEGVPTLALEADVTRGEAVERVFAAIYSEFGQVDILVNNAGLGVEKRFADTGREDWDLDIGVNLYGPLYCTKAIIRQMIDQRSGKIITIVSDAGRVGEPHLPVYSAAKAGAIGFSRALAKDVGKYGINVNCVAMGATRTPLIAGMLTPEVEAKLVKLYPLRRLATPEDAANAVAFLASDLAGFITGQVLPVNGGYSTGF